MSKINSHNSNKNNLRAIHCRSRYGCAATTSWRSTNSKRRLRESAKIQSSDAEYSDYRDNPTPIQYELHLNHSVYHCITASIDRYPPMIWADSTNKSHKATWLVSCCLFESRPVSWCCCCLCKPSSSTWKCSWRACIQSRRDTRHWTHRGWSSLAHSSTCSTEWCLCRANNNHVFVNPEPPSIQSHRCCLSCAWVVEPGTYWPCKLSNSAYQRSWGACIHSTQDKRRPSHRDWSSLAHSSTCSTQYSLFNATIPHSVQSLNHQYLLNSRCSASSCGANVWCGWPLVVVEGTCTAWGAQAVSFRRSIAPAWQWACLLSIVFQR